MKNNTKFKKVLDTISEGILILNEDLTITDASTAVHQFLHQPPEHLIGKNYFDMLNAIEMPERDKNSIFSFLTKKSEKDHFQCIYNNTQLTIEIIRGLKDSYNWLILYESKTDILNYLNTISSLMPGYFYWKDRDGYYLGCNQALLDMLGFTQSEMLGKSDYDIWPEQADALRQHDKRVMENKCLLRLEEEVFIENVGKRYYTAVKMPLYDQNNNVIGIIGNSLDITPQIEMQRDLEKAKEAAEAASIAKSEFIANMSHDIRTPITGILGLAQSLKDHSENVTNQEDAQLLIGSAEELLSLLNEVIEVVQIESKEIESNKENFDLKTLIEHNIQLLKPALRHKNIKFNDKFNLDVPRYLYGNRAYLDRILLNLLSNAIKFTDQGSVSLITELKERNQDQILLQITVADTGIGIPKDKQEIIFEHFSRLTPSYTGLYKGHGLGLYTVKRYLEAMKGTIEVNSEINKGSQFIITIPFAIGKEVEESFQKVYETTKEMPAPKEIEGAKILLVEDQPLTARMAEQLLQKMNCQIIHAKDGKSALAYASSQPFDFILMDVGLPDATGMEISKKIRALPNKNYSQTPIIALTGHMAEEKRKACLEAGMQEMLTKPLTMAIAEHLLQQYSTTAKITLPEPEEAIISLKSSAIDLEDGMNIIGGDINAAKEVLTMLAQTIQEDFKEIQKAYDNKNYDEMYELVHKFYGGLCYCGVPRLREITKQLKEVLIKNETSKLTKLIKTLSQEIDLFLKEYGKL